MMTSTLIRQAWWKLLLLSLLSAWLSVINIWFGSTFFVAVAFGVIIGHIVFHTLYDGGVPRSGSPRPGGGRPL